MMGERRLSRCVGSYPAGMLVARVMLVLLLVVGVGHAADADRILGSWVSSDGKAHIAVTHGDGSTYVGTIQWLGSPNDEQGKPRLDDKNPDEHLRAKPIVGLRILKDLTFDSGNDWSGGWIYDPESGKTYHCNATLSKDQNALDLRGYIGISLLGRTETWTRVPAKSP
jgi:uncharacterized protein (DUF2147 family)